MKIEQTIRVVPTDATDAYEGLQGYLFELLSVMAQQGWYVAQISQAAGVCILLFQRTV